MRPIRLHMENFGSFRAAADVDFAEVDYFALVGATGAGKSTVIDAICFALYGSVPRWGKENVVAYALAPSAASGKVALVFEVSGRRYAAVRTLLRDAKGTVRTKEARLDLLDPSIPADADLVELTATSRPVAEGEQVAAEVAQVTGLEYKFFTQCVVLPQGRFAEFLHATPSDRQDLLVQLLDADVYEQVRKAAVAEESRQNQAAEFARGELSRLHDADERAEEAARERAAALHTLSERVGADLEELRALDEAAKTADAERVTVLRALAQLGALALPGEVPGLAESARRATERAETAAREQARLDALEEQAEAELEALGDQTALTRELADLTDRTRRTAEAEAARAEADTVTAQLAEAAETLATAFRDYEEADRHLTKTRIAHTAADLARTLTPGDPCPVCHQLVSALPGSPGPNDLPARAGSAQGVSARVGGPEPYRSDPTADQRAGLSPVEELAAAERRLAEIREKGQQARTRHDGLAAKAELLTTRARELAATPPPDPDRVTAIEKLLAAIDTAAGKVGNIRRDAREARRQAAQAARTVEEARRKAEQAWRDLNAARDTVAAFVPPPVDPGDVHAAWTALLAWRDDAAAARKQEAGAAEARFERARAAAQEARRVLAERVAEHGVTVNSGDRMAEQVARAAAQADERLARVREARERAADLAKRVADHEGQARVAHELALLLRANQFERWLCAEALELLVAAASETLKDLSDGQYELVLGGRGDIEVVDYAEAGLRRSARTLSGGETFQASLALALALSDQVAGLAAAAARSLDSIFLDEGFGTLDPATLDTVAATLEKLASGHERMIGVVTHVPALADRVPVRFEVSRDASGSHVRKVVR
ncbi:AAA family ATPase [Herbidospora sp. NEAU-GS84]|uniref:Nuclease SbcCD subunit C n=1 Tax=Herbidospora solisilvae TaxID=2696284 RepID=A0A7C9J7S0_9ACTN|nr:SMC family ATPase [Herbidospora solisilvae]NAS26967.1 AAA family ATPase [Herbidospora solisilvae]